MKNKDFLSDDDDDDDDNNGKDNQEKINHNTDNHGNNNLDKGRNIVAPQRNIFALLSVLVKSGRI